MRLSAPAAWLTPRLATRYSRRPPGGSSDCSLTARSRPRANACSLIVMLVSRTREQLVGGILQFLNGQDLLALAEIHTALEREIDDAGRASLVGLKERITVDAGWSY